MSKSIVSLIAAFALVALVVLAGYAFYLGIFSSVPVETRSMRSFLLVYKKQTGDYGQSVRTIGDLMKEMQAIGAQDLKGFGIYYDNPAEVDEGALRSEAGVVLSEKDRVRAAGVLQRYETRVFPSVEGAVASFPLRNSLSVSLGRYRVYPRLDEYFDKLGLTPTYVMEIYDFGRDITYFMPLSNQNI